MDAPPRKKAARSGNLARERTKVVNGASIARHATDTSLASSSRLLTVPCDQKLLVALLHREGRLNGRS
jgi:hypothetical protein